MKYARLQSDGTNEPAALGNRRTDGTYSHADTGDGISVFDEYRGYLLDGGADFTVTRHKRLSPVLKELLVQVNELPGMAQQPSFNPAALSAYNFNSVMQQVAQFYCHPTRGLGIDLYWCRRDFTVFGTQFNPDNNLPSISSHRYRFIGDLNFDHDSDSTTLGLSLEAGKTLVLQDNRLIDPAYISTHNREQYRAYASRDRSTFIAESRDPLLADFVKLILIDRRGEIQFSTQENMQAEARIPSGGNALSYTQSLPLEKQGAFICVASIAEEGFYPSNQEWVTYSSSQFINQLIWAIAHEIGHLLTVDRINLPRHHFPSPNTLMTDVNPVPLGISTITASSEELLTVDLKTRYSTPR